MCELKCKLPPRMVMIWLNDILCCVSEGRGCILKASRQEEKIPLHQYVPRLDEAGYRPQILSVRSHRTHSETKIEITTPSFTLSSKHVK